jgi:hypothetical protein
VASDSLWLSPNYELDSCHITLLHTNGDAHVRHYFSAFEALLHKYNARPHWGTPLSLSLSLSLGVLHCSPLRCAALRL